MPSPISCSAIASRFTQQPLVGDPPHTPPGDHQVAVSERVALHCPRGPVGRAAVGLDDQPLVAPDEVALVALDVDVHLGAREAVLVAEGEEELLEKALGTGAARSVNGQH
jgi:hypothetical protein